MEIEYSYSGDAHQGTMNRRLMTAPSLTVRLPHIAGKERWGSKYPNVIIH